MTTEDRIQAVERFGFTRRQAAFLTMAMSHSGVCLPRQFASFASVAYGHKVNRFFERLVRRGFASVCPCLHNRALVYHVHHRPLYAAIGQAQSRLRRPVAAASVMPRLMLLDAVLDMAGVSWLAGEHDKVEHFTTGGGIPREGLPQRASRAGGAASSRLFPDALPIGVEASNRTLFVYAAIRSSLVDFRPFLRRHHALLAGLPAWTLRLVFAADERPAETGWQAVIDREIGPLLGLPERAERRVEWHALGHRYGHLSPLVAALAWSRLGVEQGERRGEQAAARSQPPWLIALRPERREPKSARQASFRTNNCWPCVM
jgi:hypothetical protein